MQDVRLALRALRSTPLVTAVAVLSLALGIGANTAIFSILDRLLLRRLPVPEPDRLALVLSRDDPRFFSWSYMLWNQIRPLRDQVFDTAVAFSPTRFNLSERGETSFVDGLWVSGNFFSGLGVSPLLGRTLTDADDDRAAVAGASRSVAVLSYAFWQRLGGDADIVGRTQPIGTVPFTIVGVMPQDFTGVVVGSTFDIAVPIAAEPLLAGRDSWLDRTTTSALRIVARVKDGQTLTVAQQALRGVQPQIREAALAAETRNVNRANYLSAPFALHAMARGHSPVRDRYRQAVLAIMAVVALVLLIACANVANLLLAKADARRHEFSVRLALGGSRWRLARQLLVESTMLAAVAALVGLAIAQWGSALMVRALSTRATTVFLDTRIDWRVLAFTIAVAASVALAFGMLPAVRASGSRPMDVIREHGRGVAGGRRAVSSALVVVQVALSLVLVVGAGLFLRTFSSLTTVDLGFDRSAVLLARFDASPTGLAPAARGALFERVFAEARALPGVGHAAMSEVTPVSGLILDVAIEIEGGARFTTQGLAPFKNAITPGWFATYGTRLVAGRDFDARDSASSPPVVIVNETFARQLMEGRNPVGHRIRNLLGGPGEGGDWMEIVGVAADATYLSIRSGVPSTMYVPMAQQAVLPPNMSLSVRSDTQSAAALTRAIAGAAERVDRRLAMTFTPLNDQIRASLVQERLVAMLSGFFGGLALLLAGLGLYGVTWHAVSRRRTEIGIRMALGAAPADVVRLVLRRALLVVALGTAAGAGLSLWASTYVATLLYGLQPRDPTTLVTSALVLAMVGAAAAWLPAHRASRIDPSHVLRDA